jgi:AraC-like DNA-binding protein
MAMTAVSTIPALQGAHNPFDPYLDERETARLLGVSPRTLQRHRQHNTGPAFLRPSPGRVVYRLSTLIEWARLREQGGADAAQ